MTTPEEDARADRKELWEIHNKSLTTLMVSHAAGLVTCLTLLKDYKVESPGALKGIGIFVWLFGLGLLSSALASFFHLVLRGQMIAPSDRSAGFQAARISFSFMVGPSVALLLTAIILAIGKFGFI
jgi:hypothetical protein